MRANDSKFNKNNPFFKSVFEAYEQTQRSSDGLNEIFVKYYANFIWNLRIIIP